MCLSTSRIAITSLLFLLIAVPIRQAGASGCPSGVAFVDGEEPVDVVCDAAHEVVRLLDACGIVQYKPFRARIVAELPVECPPNALGFFNASTKEVVVATYDTCVEMTDSDDRFGIAMSRPLYRSLLVHEFVHALVDQHADISRAGHEYIAYVIQFASMDTRLRNRIKMQYPHMAPVAEKELNDNYFYLSPPDFATKAYSHFNMPGNGCGFIQDLIHGNKKLPSGNR